MHLLANKINELPDRLRTLLGFRPPMVELAEQREPTRLPPGTAVCLGVFDGMHLGHQALVDRAQAMGEGIGLVTFEPHPRQILDPARAPQRLQTPAQRRRVCAALGVKHLVLLPFSRELAATRAEDFVREVLTEGLRPSAVVVGEDFRFGRGREGDAAMLETLLAPAGIEVVAVGPVPVPAAARPAGADPEAKLGATAVRQAVAAGELERAGAMLGRWHAVAGTVVKGAQRGRTIGFPTANLEAPGAFLPPPGVYASVLAVWSPGVPDAGAIWPAVSNLGRNPTFTQDQSPLSLEAHVLDHDLGERLYGLEVELSLIARLRDEQRFDGPQALIAQIRRDADAARRRLDAQALARVLAPPSP